MKQGSLELIFLGAAFLALQVWWIRMTIKNGQDKKSITVDEDSLARQKILLEELIKR